MIKALTSLALLMSTTVTLTTTATAAGVGPEIAYSTRGSRPALYLVNPDGSGLRLLYRGARNMVLGAIDMKPGGGEISFYEVGGPALTGHFRTVQYGATGTLGTVTRSIPGCRFSIDYHPNDGSLLMVDICVNQLNRLGAGSTTPTAVGVPATVRRARWLRDGVGFIYNTSTKLWRSSVDSPAVAEEIISSSGVPFFATANTSNQALWVATDNPVIDLVDIDSKTLTPGIEQGHCPHFSPDDVHFLYMTPQQPGGIYLMIRRTDGAGLPTRIGKKANYAACDWRN